MKKDAKGKNAQGGIRPDFFTADIHKGNQMLTRL